MDGPDSSYSCLLIHICWKVDRDARMEPPIQTEYLRSGGAMIYWGKTLYKSLKRIHIHPFSRSENFKFNQDCLKLEALSLYFPAFHIQVAELIFPFINKKKLSLYFIKTNQCWGPELKPNNPHLNESEEPQPKRSLIYTYSPETLLDQHCFFVCKSASAICHYASKTTKLTLIFMVLGARAVISFCILSAMPGYMVVPPDNTVLA